QPASGADARLLGPGAHLEGGGHHLPHAHRRDPGRLAQAAAREAARGGAQGRRRGEARAHRPRREDRRAQARSRDPAMAPRRLRELGVSIGRYAPGPLNAITDVGGVRVGHTTLISGEGALEKGKGPVRTGISCVMPHLDVYRERLIGGSFVLNGAGEVAGLTQVSEGGLIETPILLTNKLSAGKVAGAAGKWMSEEHTRDASDG